MSLTREQILSATSLAREEVQVPQWGGSVWIRTLTALDRGRYDESFLDEDRKVKNTSLADMKIRLVALCACDESGQALFTEADIAALGQTGADAVDACFDVASRLNAIGKKDQDDLLGN
jgi:hypothetical protein